MHKGDSSQDISMRDHSGILSYPSSCWYRNSFKHFIVSKYTRKTWIDTVRCGLTIRFLYNKLSIRMLGCIYAHNLLGIGFRELQRMIGQTNYNSYYYCISKLRKYDVIATTPKDKKIHLTEKGTKICHYGSNSHLVMANR